MGHGELDITEYQKWAVEYEFNGARVLYETEDLDDARQVQVRVAGRLLTCTVYETRWDRPASTS